MTNELTPVEQLKTEIPAIVAEANALVIKNDEDNQRAAEIINRLGAKLKMAEVVLMPFEEAQRAAKSALDNLKGIIYTPAKAARDIIRRKMGDYALAEQRKRDAIAAEAQKKAEAELKKEVRKTVRQGIPAPILPVAPVIAAVPVQAAGATFSAAYSAEVVDIMALIKSVAAGKTPIDAIQANTVWLNMTARNRKTEGELYPGVKSIKRMIAKSARG